MKRLTIVLMAIGPVVGCMETVPYQNVRPVSSASALMDREIGAAPAGLSDADRAAYIARRYPGRPTEPLKTQEQRDREEALADRLEYEEAVAKAPWRGWSKERIEQEARDNSIFPMYVSGAEEGKQSATMMGINLNMGEVRVGENRYGEQLLESELYHSPYRDSGFGYATLICDRSLMSIGNDIYPVAKWTPYGTINTEWIALGSICAMAKAMQ